LESVDDQFKDVSSPVDWTQQTAIGRYLEALRIGSSILRNSELVGDVALKRQSYSQFSAGWCSVLIEVTAAVDQKKGLPSSVDEMRDDPVLRLLEGMLPTDNPGMARYLKQLILPNVIVSLALESIGTPKLQRIMEAHKDSASTTVQKLLDVFLMVDLRLPKWTTHLESLLKHNGRNRFVADLIFTKLFQIFMIGRLQLSEEEKVRGLLAECITLMVGESRGGQKSRIKGNFLSGLEKKRLSRRKR
jgi:hypothetical protein